MDSRSLNKTKPIDDESLVETAAKIAGVPIEIVTLLFATHEPQELNNLMDRAFGDAYDDLLLQSMVTLTNGFAHALERHRRRRGLPPLKLRCMSCQDRR